MVESPKGPLINNEMIIWRDQNKSSEYFHGSSGIWWMVDGFNFTVLKYRGIKTFQGKYFTVSSVLVIKLKVVEDVLL